MASSKTEREYYEKTGNCRICGRSDRDALLQCSHCKALESARDYIRILEEQLGHKTDMAWKEDKK